MAKDKNIGFVSTRFAGIDGVSLEASKWEEVFKESGYKCFWFAGELDRDPVKSFLEPTAHFKHEQNQWINKHVLGKPKKETAVIEVIYESKSSLKDSLEEYTNNFNIDLLIAENILSLPLNIPLSLALSEFITEKRIPTIAHHHDFYWERKNYIVNAVGDYLKTLPPNFSELIKHVTINSLAQDQLGLRGIESIVIPNVMDFENPPIIDDEKTYLFRESIGLEPDDMMILQPTRIIQRKGIEKAIELVKKSKDPRYKLIVSHEAGDEGFDYVKELGDYAQDQEVALKIVDMKVVDPWNNHNGAEHSLWDIYPHADFITFPSFKEGFGNAFLEAIYFKKPLLINRYATFVKDIEPKGFDLVVMDGFVSGKNVKDIKEILENPKRRERMVNHNYEVAKEHYSYSVLRKQLKRLISK